MKISPVDYLKLQAQLLGPTKPSSTNFRDIEGVKSIVDKLLSVNGVEVDWGGKTFIKDIVENTKALIEEPRVESDGFFVPTDPEFEPGSTDYTEDHRY